MTPWPPRSPAPRSTSPGSTGIAELERERDVALPTAMRAALEAGDADAMAEAQERASEIPAELARRRVSLARARIDEMDLRLEVAKAHAQALTAEREPRGRELEEAREAFRLAEERFKSAHTAKEQLGYAFGSANSRIERLHLERAGLESALEREIADLAGAALAAA